MLGHDARDLCSAPLPTKKLVLLTAWGEQGAHFKLLGTVHALSCFKHYSMKDLRAERDGMLVIPTMTVELAGKEASIEVLNISSKLGL